MIVILAVLFAFIIPVLFVLWREWKHKKKEEAKEGVVAAPKEKEPLNIAAIIKVAAVLLILGIPVFFLSAPSYRYYPADESALKVGFKHSGKRVVECDEAELIKKEGERYRKALKSEGQVKMDIAKLAGCPRERFPVAIELAVDGKVILDKAYVPTGIKKDMASYIYDEFTIQPGVHKVSVRMYDKKKEGEPEFTLVETVEFKPREIRLVRFDDKENRLVIE